MTTPQESPPEPTTGSSAPAIADPQSLLGEYQVWNPPRSAAATPASLASLPDEYFEPTPDELKAAWASQSRLVDRLNNAPLKTQATRDQETNQKLSRWPETRIRIKFPNQLLLEKKFPSTDKIKSVYTFVRNALTDEAKPIKFILYEAPPRRELKVSDPEVKTKSLARLGLAPSSVLHLSFVDDALNSTRNPPPLLPEVLRKAVDLPPPPTFAEPSSSGGKGKGRSTGGGGLGDMKIGDMKLGDIKLPKWLNLGNK
ncbi:hypothetical protein FRB99_006519 [Tulasnella sp. 403]|nr:hypothetical protein FRB99_006519 [Tulasnella sp. 403]